VVDGDGGDDELFGGPADVVRGGDGNDGLIGNQLVGLARSTTCAGTPHGFGSEVLLGGNGDDLFLGDNPMGPADPSHDVGKGQQCSDSPSRAPASRRTKSRRRGRSGAPSSVPDH
jgi:hypothetical protein